MLEDIRILSRREAKTKTFSQRMTSDHWVYYSGIFSEMFVIQILENNEKGYSG